MILAALALIVPTLIRFGEKEKNEEPQLRIDCSKGAFGDLPARMLLNLIADNDREHGVWVDFRSGQESFTLRIHTGNPRPAIGCGEVFIFAPEGCSVGGGKMSDADYEALLLRLYSLQKASRPQVPGFFQINVTDDVTLNRCAELFKIAVDIGFECAFYFKPVPPKPERDTFTDWFDRGQPLRYQFEPRDGR